MLSPDEIARLVPAEEEKVRSPIPTRAISSDEFFPGQQTEKQKEFEKRVQRLGLELAKKGPIKTTFLSGCRRYGSCLCGNE